MRGSFNPSTLDWVTMPAVSDDQTENRFFVGFTIRSRPLLFARRMIDSAKQTEKEQKSKERFFSYLKCCPVARWWPPAKVAEIGNSWCAVVSGLLQLHDHALGSASRTLLKSLKVFRVEPMACAVAAAFACSKRLRLAVALYFTTKRGDRRER